MRKIPTLFLRDEKTHQLLDEVNPEAQWVVAGEGVATRKFDGTPVLIQDGKAYKRFELKANVINKPEGWWAAQSAPDPITGGWPGWVPISAEDPADAYFQEALSRVDNLPNGTYEVLGPKVNGNPEGWWTHELIRHGMDRLSEAPPRNFDGLRAYLAANDIEGIVWHHPDGRMVKIKGKDFGIRRVKPLQGAEKK